MTFYRFEPMMFAGEGGGQGEITTNFGIYIKLRFGSLQSIEFACPTCAHFDSEAVWLSSPPAGAASAFGEVEELAGYICKLCRLPWPRRDTEAEMRFFHEPASLEQTIMLNSSVPPLEAALLAVDLHDKISDLAYEYREAEAVKAGWR